MAVVLDFGTSPNAHFADVDILTAQVAEMVLIQQVVQGQGLCVPERNLL